jgi:hypothetical protein
LEAAGAGRDGEEPGVLETSRQRRVRRELGRCDGGLADRERNADASTTRAEVLAEGALWGFVALRY